MDVVGDGEYACQTVVRALPENAHFTGPILKKAAVYDKPIPKAKGVRGAKRKKGQRLPSPAALAEDKSVRWRTVKPTLYGREVEVLIKTMEVLWYHVAYTRPVRVVITRDPKGRIEDRAYFTTDLSRSVEAV